MLHGVGGRHGDLISLHSEEEANLVAEKTSQTGWQNFWTGLARGGDGSFSWVDGTPYDLEFWLDGEPNSIDGDGEDCVEAYYVTAQWNDAFCTDYKGFVCMIDKCKEADHVIKHIERLALAQTQNTSTKEKPWA